MEKASGPRVKARAPGDIWTPHKTHAGPAVAAFRDSNEVAAARAFEEGLASYRRQEYGEAQDAWERACKLAPWNRTYALNLRKLQDFIADRSR